MVKSINQKKDLSGSNIYIYKDFKVEQLPYFLYEVCINKYWKDGFCVLGYKFYKSNKLLDIKKYRITKKYKDYLLEKVIDLVGVPYTFIIENHLKLYEPKKKKK